mgnify:CR=1 FL=1
MLPSEVERALVDAAQEFPGWAHHQAPIAWPPAAGKEDKGDTGVPPWGDDGGNTARGGACWNSIYERREELQADHSEEVAPNPNDEDDEPGLGSSFRIVNANELAKIQMKELTDAGTPSSSSPGTSG